jgi:hypothetical protein
MLYFQQKRIISLLSEDNKDKKYYNEGNIVHRWLLYCLISLQSASVHKKLVLQRKGYELLSLYFNRTEDPNAEQCPF